MITRKRTYSEIISFFCNNKKIQTENTKRNNNASHRHCEKYKLNIGIRVRQTLTSYFTKATTKLNCLWVKLTF